MTAASNTADFDPSDPQSYRWFHSENVRFSDTDMVGHVNNVAHVALVECGRLAYAYFLADAGGLRTTAVTFARLEIDFMADLYYPATVRIGARVMRVGTTSFTVGIGVFDGDTCVSMSVNVLVTLDEDRRPTALSESMRTLLTEQMRV